MNKCLIEDDLQKGKKKKIDMIAYDTALKNTTGKALEL